MKICNKCGVEKSCEEFYAQKDTKDRLHTARKVCFRKRISKWTKANPEKQRASARNWAKANPEAHRAWKKNNPAKMDAFRLAWRKKNPKQAAASKSKWKKENRDKCNASFNARRAQQLRATPAWANQGYIEDVYRKAAIFAKRDGTPRHVDHIVPLKSKLVCGLHCEDNLQVIHGAENMAKGNRSWPHELFSVGGV